MLRYIERNLLASVTEYMRTSLTTLGWITTPINFAVPALSIINENPDVDDDVQVTPQTLAITLGDSTTEQLYQLGGGVYTQPIPVFFDVYAVNSSVAVALASDVRDLIKREQYITYQEWYTGSGVPIDGALAYFCNVMGPSRPPASEQAQSGDFRKHWRVVKAMIELEFGDS